MSSGGEAEADAKQRSRKELRGALWLFADIMLLMTMTVVAKLMGATYPVVQLVFARAVVGLAVVMPFALMYRGQAGMPSDMRMQAMRIGANAVSNCCFFAALQLLPLATMTTISYTRPFVLLAFAAAFLGERIGMRRWAWTAIAFAGVLIAVRPDSGGAPLGVLVALGAVVFGQLSVLAARKLHEETTISLMLTHNAGMIMIMAPLTLIFGIPFRAEDVPWLIAIGALGQAGQFCFLVAHRLARAAVLAPLGYVNIFFAGFAGYYFFNETQNRSGFAFQSSQLRGSHHGFVFAECQRPTWA